MTIKNKTQLISVLKAANVADKKAEDAKGKLEQAKGEAVTLLQERGYKASDFKSPVGQNAEGTLTKEAFEELKWDVVAPSMLTKTQLDLLALPKQAVPEAKKDTRKKLRQAVGSKMGKIGKWLQAREDKGTAKVPTTDKEKLTRSLQTAKDVVRKSEDGTIKDPAGLVKALKALEQFI